MTCVADLPKSKIFKKPSRSITLKGIAYLINDVGWPANTIHQLCADTGCSLEGLTGAMDDREGWWERERERESMEKRCYQNDLMMMSVYIFLNPRQATESRCWREKEVKISSSQHKNNMSSRHVHFIRCNQPSEELTRALRGSSGGSSWERKKLMDWFDWVLRHLNLWRLFNAKTYLYMN